MKEGVGSIHSHFFFICSYFSFLYNLSFFCTYYDLTKLLMHIQYLHTTFYRLLHAYMEAGFNMSSTSNKPQ
ncbi:MAG: hypothetical protein J7L58_06130, partial [Thermoplasmata archaeon]|nr:hypothetical protein [Thermoplasmata archaeon]